MKFFIHVEARHTARKGVAVEFQTSVSLVAESEAGQHVQEVACWERKEHRLEEVGLTLREAKKLGQSS